MSREQSREQLGNLENQPNPREVLLVGTELLEHFGVEVDPLAQPEQFLAATKELDPRYQEGRRLVRWELTKDQRQWPEDTKDIIMRTAEKYRMFTTEIETDGNGDPVLNEEGEEQLVKLETPLSGNFDVVIALGGANQQNHERPAYALEALQDGTASFKQLIIAGSSRKLKDPEIANAANYAKDPVTEFDLCVAGAAKVAKEYPGVPVSVLLEEYEKAGTPDVIESVLRFMQSVDSLSEHSRVAAVTTQIFQKSTELDLARVASSFGIHQTLAAGIPSPAKIIEGRTPATYLSEICRTLKAATLAAQPES